MKLPFDLRVKLIFRLILPGFFLTLGLFPALATVRDRAQWSIAAEYIFILSILVTGWFITLLDQPIYMLFEGRRFWPMRMRTYFVTQEQKRLRQLLVERQTQYTDSRNLALPDHERRASDRKYKETRWFARSQAPSHEMFG